MSLKSPDKNVYSIMLSSTFEERAEHRQAVREAMLGQRLLPIAMEDDAALADKDLIDASLAKVDEADAYVGLIGYRYGQIPQCVERNPDHLSLTELEFRRAVARGIPICMFIMHSDHSVPMQAVRREHGTKRKLNRFLKSAKNNRIFAEFRSIDDLKWKAILSLGKLRETLDELAYRLPSGASHSGADTYIDDSLPIPPAPYEKSKYIPNHKFVGRETELALIREWATATEPVLVFEAIGGMGKSMLTWYWVQQRAHLERRDWAGVIWYSFYERGADANDFCISALAYMTRSGRRSFRGRKTSDLVPELIKQLQSRAWLVILDGLERVLVAYHRHDAAQTMDEDIGSDPERIGRSPQACIRPADDEFLQKLCVAAPSKVLVSSRLMPNALLNRSGQPLPGVKHVQLRGLAPEDAEGMLREIGVRGESIRIRNYLESQFGCHPLVVGVVAGLVYYFPPAPGNFDRWVEDPAGGNEINLANLDLRQRRNHILKAAFADLEHDTLELLSRLAVISAAVDWDVVDALNPRRPDPPEEVKQPVLLNYDSSMDIIASSHKATNETARKQLRDKHREAKRKFEAYQSRLSEWEQSAELREARQWLTSILLDLEKRGLVQRDQQTGKFDLHPVVRGFAVGSLSVEARGLSSSKVADYFSSRPPPQYEEAAALADLVNGIQVVHALSLAGRYDDALLALKGNLSNALLRLEYYHEWLALLRPFFSNGWQHAPVGIKGRAGAASEAGVVLGSLGRHQESAFQFEFAISVSIAERDMESIAYCLANYYTTLDFAGNWARVARIVQLAFLVAKAIGDKSLVDWVNVDRCEMMLRQGEVTGARALWKKEFGEKSVYTRTNRLQAAIIETNMHLMWREGRLTEDDIAAAIAEVDQKVERGVLRLLWWIRANFRQSSERHVEAVDAFEQAIATSRSVGLNFSEYEARYGLSLSRLGRDEEARLAAARADTGDGRAHTDLSELYLALSDRTKAREHALAGYHRAWGDGPPFVDHWALETCRKLLRVLGEAEPHLTSFKAAKVKPFPFEADIKAMLKES